MLVEELQARHSEARIAEESSHFLLMSPRPEPAPDMFRGAVSPFFTPVTLFCHPALVAGLPSCKVRPKDFCLQNVNNLYCGGIHPVFNEKSEKK